MLYNIWASLVAQMVKSLPAMQETLVQSLGQEDRLEREMATPSSILASNIGERSLVGYSLWGHKELNTTEHMHIALALLTFCTR